MSAIKLGGSARPNQPATEEEIQAALANLTPGVPAVLADFWRQANGAVYEDTNVYLYSTEDIVERNETYEVAEYAPDLLLVGDNGGGEGFFIKRHNEEATVWIIDLGAIGSTEGQKIANSFEAWLANGTALTLSPLATTSSNNKQITVYLVRAPKQGLKGLLEIKSKLKLDTSIAELKQALTHLPFPLLVNVYFSKYEKEISELNDTQDCLTYE